MWEFSNESFTSQYPNHYDSLNQSITQQVNKSIKTKQQCTNEKCINYGFQGEFEVYTIFFKDFQQICIFLRFLVENIINV